MLLKLNSFGHRSQGPSQQGTLVRPILKTRLLSQVPVLLASHRFNRECRTASQMVVLDIPCMAITLTFGQVWYR